VDVNLPFCTALTFLPQEREREARLASRVVQKFSNFAPLKPEELLSACSYLLISSVSVAFDSARGTIAKLCSRSPPL